MQVERVSASEWNDALPRTGTGIFHGAETLAVLEEHSPYSLELVVGFKGDRPVALLPLFVRSTRLGRLVTSPPPGLNVLRLGPVVMPASPKRGKRERLNRRFARAVIDEFGIENRSTVFYMVCHADFEDPRPFGWTDLNVETLFTYRLDLAASDPDQLLAAASKSLRREVRDAAALDLTVKLEGLEAARQVFELTRERHAEQGRSLSMTWPYVRDVIDSLDEMARVYTIRTPRDELLTGIIVLYSPEQAYFWHGGGRTEFDGVAVNSYLHWQIIRDVYEDPPVETVRGYDLYGANTERLCRYKRKFGGQLVPYYRIDTGGLRMLVAERAYEFARR